MSTSDKIFPEWMIRPCDLYKEEYDDCKCFKARFHQYFIYGKELDCTQWKTDYNNCIKYTENNDMEAGEELVNSEEKRRQERLRGHYANNVWKKRKEPPEDWNKPLPDWLAKQNEHSYLALKNAEFKNGDKSDPLANRTLCVIM